MLNEETHEANGSLSSGASAVGCEREHNEDHYDVFTCPRGTAGVVCDGMGGVQGGEFASQLAVQAVRESLSRNSDETLSTLLLSAVEKANESIFQHRENGNYSSMGTTLVAALIDTFKGSIIHIGDSRAYLVRNRKLEQLTRDHTYVQEWVEKGTLSESEALDHPQAHVLSRCLGVAQTVSPVVLSFSILPLNSGETEEKLVLASDGLHRIVSEDEIGELVGRMTPEQSSKRIIDLAKDRGGPDDMTIVVISLGGTLLIDKVENTSISKTAEAAVTTSVQAPTVLPSEEEEMPISLSEESLPLEEPITLIKRGVNRKRRTAVLSLVATFLCIIVAVVSERSMSKENTTGESSGPTEETIFSEEESKTVSPSDTPTENETSQTDGENTVAETPVSTEPETNEALSPEALFQHALENAKNGDTEGAIIILEKVLAAQPDFAEAHYNLGTLYAQNNRYEEATSELEQAADLKQGFAEAVYNLAYAHLQQGHDVIAATLFKQFIEMAVQENKFPEKVLAVENFLKSQSAP